MDKTTVVFTSPEAARTFTAKFPAMATYEDFKKGERRIGDFTHPDVKDQLGVDHFWTYQDLVENGWNPQLPVHDRLFIAQQWTKP